MKVGIYIKEILQKRVEIESDDSCKALDEVKRLYKNGEIILDADDYMSTEISLEETAADNLKER